MYVPKRRNLNRLLLGYTYYSEVLAKGKSHVGKMDAIVTYSRLDCRIKRCILMNVIAPKLEYAGEVWGGNTRLVKQ